MSLRTRLPQRCANSIAYGGDGDLDKPVAFLHGDLHRFRIDHPLFSAKTNRRFENFIRVETYGSPDIHWVRVTVDPASSQLFCFDPQIVPENVANRRAK